jgi:hypothetical protein
MIRRMSRSIVFVVVLTGLSWTAVASATPVERRLHIEQAAASSFLWNDWNRFQENYHPSYVGDDDPKTAWTEGADGNGEGQWLRMPVTEMDGATRLRMKIRAGYFKSPSLYRANARAREITIKLLPSEVKKKVALEDVEDWQEITVEQPAGKLEAVEIIVDAVYPGTKYTDLCVSDVQLYVTAETPENPAYEKSKLARLKAWKGERAEAARLFKASSGKDLPLLGSYRLTSTPMKDDPPSLWEKCEGDHVCWTRESLKLAAAGPLKERHAAALALAAEVLDGKGLAPGRVAPGDRRALPIVDGIEVPELWHHLEHDFNNQGLAMPLLASVASLRADQLGALEERELPPLASVLEAKAPGCKGKKPKNVIWMRRDRTGAGGPEAVRALLIAQCGRIEVREGYADVGALQVAVYDAEGRLELTAGPGYVNGFSWSETNVLSGGRGVTWDGRTFELTAPEIAAR